MPLPLNQLSGMPQMSAAFEGWTMPITLFKVTQEVIEGLVQNIRTPINFDGTVQPLTPKQIALKPEGQRAWEWLDVHCFNTDANLTTNDRVEYDNLPYKVMGVWNWKLNNFIEYHLVRDYTVQQPAPEPVP